MAIKPVPKRDEKINVTPAASVLPSNKSNGSDNQEVNNDKSIEGKIAEIINAGGTPPGEMGAKAKKRGGGPIKNINIKFLAEEGEVIDRLRDARPKIRNKKITISLHDWFIEAMQEKIEREKKQYKIS